ncbi:MAG: iron hydrogenase small subunit [Clostridia bacterium]|nr:iron hydrogenase small subunit [Clostridia bacterium]
MINLTVNGKSVSVPEGATILDAARKLNVKIPTLCHLENIHKTGSCRICMVEVEGARTLQASCVTPASEGMVVRTNTERVRESRKIMYELILSDHPKDCLSCSRNKSCELQAVGEIIQADESSYEGEKSKEYIDESSPSIVRDAAKCILCRRCVTICNEVQGVGILNAQDRGFASAISAGGKTLLGQAACTNCGQCTVVCPVNALHEKDSTQDVWAALANPAKTVVVQTAPAIRAALGEEFGYEAGTLVTGKMASALRDMGFDHVFDTNFAADLTIIEEGTEFLNRIVGMLYQKGAISAKKIDELGLHRNVNATIPMITSCSPGWIKFIEHYYPGQLGNVSSCKSPHMMLGALAKSYFAEKIGVRPEDMYVVSIMPCTAKKYEITRPEMVNGGVANVDAVLTTRELARMIKEAGINFEKLADGGFDSPLGLSSGAADIFGSTGGVMEAALRTVYELVTGRQLPFDKLHVAPIAGFERIKTAELVIENAKEEWAFLNGVAVKVAVTSGLVGAGILMNEIKDGESLYLFIEVMGCPGGCINGGGQPRPRDEKAKEKRMAALYREDEGKKIRKSHENPDIVKIYEEFLGKPLGHTSHELLHTTYTVRGRHGAAN